MEVAVLLKLAENGCGEVGKTTHDFFMYPLKLMLDEIVWSSGKKKMQKKSEMSALFCRALKQRV
jgi:hypothetical protein